MADQPTTARAPAPDAPGEIEYGDFYYRHDCGIPYERNEHWLGFFDRIAEKIVRDLQPDSTLDAGCAMGFLVEGLRKRGVEAFGVDVSEFAIGEVHESVAEYCEVASLTEPLERSYDLITCIEVLEHIPAEDTDRAIANLCRATDRILLSSTPDDFTEATHVNVRTPEEWSAALAREGFLRDLDYDASYVTPWAALYRRQDARALTDAVRHYDRSWWRLRKEATEVRASLLSAQERMAELEKEAEGSSELRSELETSREEVLRLRDLLIGKDAELGTSRGQVAVMEARLQRTFGARLHAMFPRFAGLLGLASRALAKLRG